MPHSANRLLLTVLSGIEMVLIPQQLLLAGMTQTDALAVYGIFTGMALPLILFPATITNSASVMLMPSVAGLQALGYEKRIRYVIWRTLGTCFFFGAFCTLFFFLFGKPLGIFLFHSETAGVYIKTLAFICPFSLYQHHPGKHYERAWQTRCLSFPQCCGSVHPHWLCDPFRSQHGDPWIFLWNADFPANSYPASFYLSKQNEVIGLIFTKFAYRHFSVHSL